MFGWVPLALVIGAWSAAAPDVCTHTLRELDQTAQSMDTHWLYTTLQQSASWRQARQGADHLTASCLPISAQSFTKACSQTFYAFAAACERLQAESLFSRIVTEVRPTLGDVIGQRLAHGCLFSPPQHPTARLFAMLGLTVNLLEMAPLWREALRIAPSAPWDAVVASTQFTALNKELAALAQACQDDDDLPKCKRAQTRAQAAAAALAFTPVWRQLPTLTDGASQFLGAFSQIHRDFGTVAGIPAATQQYVLLLLYVKMAT